MYRLIVTGVGNGPYTVVTMEVGEDDELLRTEEFTGTATPGSSFDVISSVPLSVDIQVKDGQLPAVLNPSAKGTVPVRILSNGDFDAPQQVDTTTLRFGPTGTESKARSCSGYEDADLDGRPDLTCHFELTETGFESVHSRAVISGKTKAGIAVEGSTIVDVKDPGR